MKVATITLSSIPAAPCVDLNEASTKAELGMLFTYRIADNPGRPLSLDGQTMSRQRPLALTIGRSGMCFLL